MKLLSAIETKKAALDEEIKYLETILHGIRGNYGEIDAKLCVQYFHNIKRMYEMSPNMSQFETRLEQAKEQRKLLSKQSATDNWERLTTNLLSRNRPN